MIVAALLLSASAALPSGNAEPAPPQTTEAPAAGVRHVFQNGHAIPLRLSWIDPQGRAVDLGMIAPGAYKSMTTFIGHVFVLTDEEGRRRGTVRIDDLSTGSYIGTSRYRPVANRPGWHVFVDRALDPAAEPAGAALATVARLLGQLESALPPAALAQLRTTQIFLHRGAGGSGMFHRDPDWLLAHGRTVEMLNGIELSDAASFVASVEVQPGTILHELAHAYHMKLSDRDRAEIDATYRRAMESGRYRHVARHDGSVGPAYAMADAAEYFAELSEAYFSRNDFFPFTRAELAGHDPEGERLVARLWR